VGEAWTGYGFGGTWSPDGTITVFNSNYMDRWANPRLGYYYLETGVYSDIYPWEVDRGPDRVLRDY